MEVCGGIRIKISLFSSVREAVFLDAERMIFGKYGNQPVFCENVKSIKFQIQHVLPYKNQIEKIFFEAGEKILIFHLLQRERKLRMCGTETVDHRSEMVLGEKRKGSDMKGLGFTVLKNGTLIPWNDDTVWKS